MSQSSKQSSRSIPSWTSSYRHSQTGSYSSSRSGAIEREDIEARLSAFEHSMDSLKPRRS
jgi:hypothetical protein